MGSLRRGAICFVVLLSLCVVTMTMAGCGPSGGNSSSIPATQVPTPTLAPLPSPPTVPALQTISIAGFEANDVYPAAHGLVLRGTPGTTPEQLSEDGAPDLAFYNFTSQQVLNFVTATPAADGTQRGILNVAVGGDWVAYIIGDAHQSNWELWALNTYTGQNALVDSAAQSGQLSFFGVDKLVTDGQSLVWSHNMYDASNTAHAALLRYTFATGQTTKIFSESGITVTPVAMVDGDLIYHQANATENQTTSAPIGSDWMLLNGQTSAIQIPGEHSTLGTMNTNYAVWEELTTSSLSLLDRTTNQRITGWGPGCLIPVIAPTQPYIICRDYDAQAYDLISITTREYTQFYQGQAGTSAYGIGPNGNFYWIATGPTAPASDTIDAITLPNS